MRTRECLECADSEPSVNYETAQLLLGHHVKDSAGGLGNRLGGGIRILCSPLSFAYHHLSSRAQSQSRRSTHSVTALVEVRETQHNDFGEYSKRRNHPHCIHKYDGNGEHECPKDKCDLWRLDSYSYHRVCGRAGRLRNASGIRANSRTTRHPLSCEHYHSCPRNSDFRRDYCEHLASVNPRGTADWLSPSGKSCENGENAICPMIDSNYL